MFSGGLHPDLANAGASREEDVIETLQEQVLSSINGSLWNMDFNGELFIAMESEIPRR